MALEVMSERRHFLCTSGEARCTFGSAALLTAIIPVLTSPRPVINTPFTKDRRHLLNGQEYRNDRKQTPKNVENVHRTQRLPAL